MIPTSFKQRFYFIEGKIEKNQFGGNYNFLTINLGRNDSISNEMAVINSKGNHRYYRACI
jgi:cell shape-determining protein MreC